MDPLLISEEITQLKRLREFYEDQLKSVGIEMCDLGDDIHNLLDECAELQHITNLQNMSQSNLQTFYYKKKKEHVDNHIVIGKLKNEINKQQHEMEKEQKECRLLEKFTTSINKRLVSVAQMESSKLEIEARLKTLQDHLAALEIPENFNIEELIRKVELLKNEKSREKQEF